MNKGSPSLKEVLVVVGDAGNEGLCLTRETPQENFT